MLSKVTLLLSFLLFSSLRISTKNQDEESNDFWKKKAKAELEKAKAAQYLNRNKAKNIILFIGDGMGVSTVTSGRILKGQLNRQSGEEYELAMDKLPHVALSKTYCLDRQVSDSASTATALLCGVKTNYYVLGMSGKAVRSDCKASAGYEVKSVLVDAFDKGKATGIVTTTELTDGTPGSTYAHSPEREWNSDSDMPQKAEDEGCKDVAKQFFESSYMFTVALGGGRRDFQPNDTSDVEYPGKFGKRRDGRDLIKEWQSSAREGETKKYVWNKEQLDNVDIKKTDKLWGMFEPQNMEYEVDKKENEPSLVEMTEKAIKMLQKNENGYFLMVEGGRIDHGHHGNSAYEALHELVVFDDAIDIALNMTSEKDTLIIVTADHGSTMILGGSPVRGNSVFGLSADEKAYRSLDKKPYTSILYGNGPAYQGVRQSLLLFSNPEIPISREDVSKNDIESRTYRQQSAVPSTIATHGGEDVPIFARGPMAHLFHGIHEQTYIAQVIRYAACLGSDADDDDHCGPV